MTLTTLFRRYVEVKQKQQVLDYDDLLLYWHFAVQDGDAAERRHRVCSECALPRFLDRRADRNAARVSVLDDHRCRLVQLARNAPRTLEVGEVVVRELFAAELLDT